MLALQGAPADVRTVKIALFFTPDRLGAAGAGGRTVRDSSDYGYVAFTTTRDWLKNQFLQKPTVVGDDRATEVSLTGLGAAFGGPSRGYATNYEIKLVYGLPFAIAESFGRAIAASNITMLNGHFLESDAQSAAAGAESEFYAPAMHAF